MSIAVVNHHQHHRSILPLRFVAAPPPQPKPPQFLFSHPSSLNTKCNNLLYCIAQSLPSSSSPSIRFNSSTRLFVSGLSFRTTEESLRNAFNKFGELVEVNLVMDKIANRPRGFAFIKYGSEEESQKAIEGMHGKFLDGRVIFVEIAKPRGELRRGIRPNP